MRLPLTGSSVNMAGQPSRVGGTVAKVFGWIVLGAGMFVALVLGFFFQWLWPAGYAGIAIGGLVAFITAAVSLLLLRGGKSLQKSGAEEAKFTREKAIFALAAHRGGVLTSFDAATALGMRPEEADSLLTDLAKTKSDQVSLELDDAGSIYFRFPQMLGWQPPVGGPVRVDPSVAPSRVATETAQSGEPLEVEIEPPPSYRAGRTTR